VFSTTNQQQKQHQQALRFKAALIRATLGRATTSPHAPRLHSSARHTWEVRPEQQQPTLRLYGSWQQRHVLCVISNNGQWACRSVGV
jgi:hypothetical protein